MDPAPIPIRFQCGFCTPRMILTARWLWEQGIPDGSATLTPKEAELWDQLRGNLCRCTGYQAILESIQGIQSSICLSAAEQYGTSARSR